MPEPPFSRVRKAHLRDAIARRQQAKKSADSVTDESASAANDGVAQGIDEALLEDRVREEIARQLKGGKAKTERAPGRKGSFDAARLREAVRREVRRQFGIASGAAAPLGSGAPIDSELIRAAVKRVLSRRLRRQGESGEPGEKIPSRREVSPAVLEPLVRKELDRLLGRSGRTAGRVTEANVPDSAMLRERIQEVMVAYFHTGRERSRARAETLRVAYPDRAVIAEQVRAVLKRCMTRPALPAGRPLSDEAIDAIVKGALRGLPRRR